MGEQLKTAERASIEKLLRSLARKGYILRSELEHIRTGCRHNAFSLEQLRQILEQCLAEDVRYIDDEQPDGSVRHCVQLQETLEKWEFPDLFTYLKLAPDARMEQIKLALKEKRNEECDEKIQLLQQEQDLEVYAQVLQTRQILEQMQLRRDFGIPGLRQSEYDQYLQDMMLLAFLAEAAARHLLDGYLESMSMTVLPDLRLEQSRDRQCLPDDFGICLEEDRQHGISRDIGRTK